METTGEQDAPTPSAELDGDQNAPAPSAEQDGPATETPEPTMLDAIAGDLEEQFGPVSDDPEHQEPQGADATDSSDPHATQDPELAASNDDDPQTAKVGEQDATQAGADDQADEDDNQPLPDEVSEAELAQYTRKAGRRVHTLLGQRRALREEVDQLRPLHEHIRSLELGGEDVMLTLDAAQKLKVGDWQGFKDLIEPYWQAANQALGNALPPALQEQVEQGYIAPELASQLAANQAQAAWTQNQLATQRQMHAAQLQQLQQEQEQAAQEQVRVVLNQAVNDWESQVRQADPDFDAKADLLKSVALGMVAEQGQPQSVDAVLQLAKTAYDRVNNFGVVNRSPPQPTRAAPDAGIGSRHATPEVDSYEAAVLRGLADANSV